MSDTLLDRLRGLPESQWASEGPGSVEVLEDLERRYDIRLPDDYRSLMLASNGGEISGRLSRIQFEPLEILRGHNLDERFRKYLPGMFVIGDNGGGSIYYYDPRGRLGHGANALFLVALGTLGFPYSIFVGTSLSAAADMILGGEDFNERPRLGTDPTPGALT